MVHSPANSIRSSLSYSLPSFLGKFSRSRAGTLPQRYLLPPKDSSQLFSAPMNAGVRRSATHEGCHVFLRSGDLQLSLCRPQCRSWHSRPQYYISVSLQKHSVHRH